MCQIKQIYNKTKNEWKHNIINDGVIDSSCEALYKITNKKVHGRELLYNEIDYGVRLWIEVKYCFYNRNKQYGEEIDHKEEKQINKII